MRVFSLLFLAILTACTQAPIQPGLYKLDGSNSAGTPYHGTVSITVNDDMRYTFKWCLDSIMYGQGYRHSHQLVIDWGSDSPVIYAILPNMLDGVWDDGKASERLTLVTPALSADCEQSRL